MKTGLGRFDGNPLTALSVEGLIDHTHAALADFPQYFKPLGDDLASLKGARELPGGNRGQQQEAAHPLLPLHRCSRLLVELLIVVTSKAQVRFAFCRRLPEGL